MGLGGVANTRQGRGNWGAQTYLAAPAARRQGVCNAMGRTIVCVKFRAVVPRIRARHRRPAWEEVRGREYRAQRLMENSSRVHLMPPLMIPSRLGSRRAPRQEEAGAVFRVSISMGGRSRRGGYGTGRRRCSDKGVVSLGVRRKLRGSEVQALTGVHCHAENPKITKKSRRCRVLIGPRTRSPSKHGGWKGSAGATRTWVEVGVVSLKNSRVCAVPDSPSPQTHPCQSAMEANANVNLSCCPLRQHAAAAARSRREHPPGRKTC